MTDIIFENFMGITYSKGFFLNDIAIIKLSKPAKFNKYVNPVCLPSNAFQNFDSVEAKVSGWGLVYEEKKEKDKSESGWPYPNILQKVKTKII